MVDNASSESWVPPDGSWASSIGNRRSMLGNRSRDTSPELALRSLVHARGLRYRVASRPLAEFRRTADMVFRPVRVAVFVDGCYWHGCPDHFVLPKTNTQYWRDKIDRNILRDRETDHLLESRSWLVLRFWEHDNPAACAELVCSAVLARKDGTPMGESTRAPLK